MTVNENLTESLNIANYANYVALQYDEYYHGEGDSIFNKRFGQNKILYREAELINNAFIRTIRNIANKADIKQTIKILDFGCGDGRLFKVIENLSKSYNKFQIELIAYDISKTGIENFAKNLLNCGYKLNIEENKNTIQTKYELHVFHKMNLKVKLLCGFVEDCYNSFLNIIGINNIDFVMCMYGVIAHIPTKALRLETLKMLKSIIKKNGEFLITVATPRVFRNEVIAYNTLREQIELCIKANLLDSTYHRKLSLRLALENNDIYYCNSSIDKGIDNYVHVYEIKELHNDLRIAGFKINFLNTLILCIKQPYEISSYFWKQRIDLFVSYILSLPIVPLFFKQKYARHIALICKV